MAPLSPQEFSKLLGVTDSTGQPAMIAGGQAVNLWALYYFDQESELAGLGPFVSKDLDFLADQETVRQLSQLLAQQPVRPPKGDPNPILASFNFTTPNGSRTTVEVLFTLYGMNPEKIRERSVLVEIGTLNQRIRLPDLASCLDAKIHNTLHLNQEHRQDLKHVRILLLCNRAFIRDLLRKCEASQLSGRGVINALEALFKVVRTESAERLSQRFHVDWSLAFPIEELTISTSNPIQSFMKKRFLPYFSKTDQ